MRVAVLGDRTTLVIGDRAVDAERASGVRPSDPGALPASGSASTISTMRGELKIALLENPLVFPKFSSSIVGPNEMIATRSSALDWEAELVVVIGAECNEVEVAVAVADAASVIAGYTISQDLGERVVRTDEIGTDPQLDIRYEVDGEEKQSSNTRNLIFGVPALVSCLSFRVRLHPGDLVFTGTPAGVGWSREPGETLRAGSRIVTTIERIGTLSTAVVSR